MFRYWLKRQCNRINIKLAALTRRQCLVLAVFHLFLLHAVLVKFVTNLVNRMKNNRTFYLKYTS
jgi:hypothetical protein